MTAPHDALGRDKQPERISSMFDAIAHRYDLLNHLLSAGLDFVWRWRAIRSLALEGGETVVDLCCGTADFAIAATRGRRGAGRVVGVDFSSGMLRFGLQKLRRSGDDRRIHLVQGDAMRIPAASESAEAATVAFGIRNVQEPAVVYADVLRVLRPGGRFAILEFGVPPWAPVRALYLGYFTHVLPRIGRLLSGHTSAYTYLPASVSSFPKPERVVADLAACGFVDVKAVRLSLGVVYLYRAVKPQ